MRTNFLALAALTVIMFGLVSCGGNKAVEPRILIAYYSHTGNTKALAEQVHALTGGDIFEIATATPYPEDNHEAHELTRSEKENGVKPALRGQMPDMSQYDMVFIGSPNWFGSYANPVLTFVSDSDLTGKTVVPFLTYGGNEGNYFADMAGLCEGATMLEGFAVRGGEADEAKDLVIEWLTEIGVKVKQ